MTNLGEEQAAARHIRSADYVSCTVAFIDCRKPGSHLKENYAIIGPGVTSADEQVVNLPEPHGFNIGAAAMPNGITNNLHVHFTAEVVIVQKGEWTFRWGAKGEHTIVGREGDIVSVPTWVFRGFTNTGPDDGWLFTVLGGDNTGGVIFHPDIIREAAGRGLYISADNRLIDTARGDPLPAAGQTIPPMPEEAVTGLRVVSPEAMRRRVVTEADRDFRPAFLDAALAGCGAEIAPVIGHGITQNRDHEAPITNPHGFSVEWLRLAPGQRTGPFTLAEKLVLILRKGALRLRLNAGGDVAIDLAPRDTFALPAGVACAVEATGDAGAEGLVVVAGDHRKRPSFPPAVAAAARQAGFALDAGGYVAKAALLPRYSRGG